MSRQPTPDILGDVLAGPKVTQVKIRWANATGLCPVCQVRPLADWPDGVRRATCASLECHHRWLNIRPAPAPRDDGFVVGLVMGD